MPLFVLSETSAGYALFKAKDKKLLKQENLTQSLSSIEAVCNALKLKKFQKFQNAVEALNEASAIGEGKITPVLVKLLETIQDESKATLAVADPKLANAIKNLPQLSIIPVSDASTLKVHRAVRQHLTSLIPTLLPSDVQTMNLGLSHSLSRHKLKFSPDKVDTMVIQAVSLLDDLDKEVNTYAMRVKEWYGWHFPEMARIINDNVAYAKIILKAGFRANITPSDLSDILPEEIEAAIKSAAEVSMGTEIADDDLEHIQMLATQVVSFTEYRTELSNYLRSRMESIAPNLTVLVGELVGARLISHAGSLLNLAKSPGSTIQIIGAEKALFRALKTKHDTPKYGLIYHASLVGQASGKNKGKIARMVASRAALSLRVDALSPWGSHSAHNEAAEPSEEEKTMVGMTSRQMIERRLRHLEGRAVSSISAGPNGTAQPAKWEIKEARKYNADADGLDGNAVAAAARAEKLVQEVKEDGDVSMMDVDSDSDAAPAPVADSSDSDSSEDDEEAKRRAEKEARRARKAEKKAKKEDKKSKKDQKEEKKRKRDESESESEVEEKKSKKDKKGKKAKK